MCVRMSPLTVAEAQAVLDKRGQASAHAIELVEKPDPLYDAHPGSTVPVYVPEQSGHLMVLTLSWGFALNGKESAVFNTRLESALEQIERGRRGMWAEAIQHGRCLVPVRAFYESHATERVESERTGKPVRRQYRFRLPGARAFLLAGVQAEGRFSVVTTTPNASVAPVHNRMPLVLGPGESSIWLGADFARLADRSTIHLIAEPER